MSGTPALREIVSEGETGEVFRTDDVDDLAACSAGSPTMHPIARSWGAGPGSG